MAKSNLNTSERKLCNNIIQYLGYHGVFCWRENAGLVQTTNKYGQSHRVRLGFAGKSDILGMYKGSFLALEVKLPQTRNKVTSAQNEFLERVRLHGGIAAVVTSPEEALKVVKGGI